jgi:drug/metabolite transporter (DMT)-like permease
LDVARLKPRILFLTLLAMIAFASNSLLCRAALKQTSIDAASFTFIRIFSGAVALWIVLQTRRKLIVDRTASPLVERSEAVTSFPSPPAFARLRRGEQSSPNRRGGPFSLREKVGMRAAGNWISALALFAYAAAFSFAYNTLSAGTGALLLFGAVQATMILWGFRKGERLRAIQIVGLIVAVAGLLVLVFPGLSAPPLVGSILMLGAGVAWGVYSLRGKVKGQSGSDRDVTASTAGNFLRAVPFAALVSVVMLPKMHLDSLGVTYAVISGAITSGLGYVIWYAALAGLKAASAATVQLSVPVLAATGGILLLGEPVTLRYVIASAAVLGGIFLVVIEKRQASPI